mmetsp:Transcript_2979/g.7244  ORF Transcript_2979/g.7244 Transcript_2979/m.7244 type:complete len:121 (+) Transcript_2979:344-706(+)|eukprot:CAMPEP_0198236708 /NCGR_PEP_ID=MMETSP1446-20131203/2595_1 /TAXON_ID=1461542 ORGANISM="Unidentified sp, Strain CCMP2111" /NCGR_SAMPLE_ID=MMETSP1446 /ASSEMBLY_ACC=CAM_ASM_001112 /LENGTH=120 /DNA_ID=CAMNT_0043918595 /DNA_START=178 /DNA_END=540 /DNA_ORIENTATION=-
MRGEEKPFLPASASKMKMAGRGPPAFTGRTHKEAVTTLKQSGKYAEVAKEIRKLFEEDGDLALKLLEEVDGFDAAKSPSQLPHNIKLKAEELLSERFWEILNSKALSSKVQGHLKEFLFQ